MTGGNLRHELRTPLNHIINYAELLDEEADAAGHDGYRPDFKRIRDAAWKLLELMEQSGFALPEADLPASDEPPFPASNGPPVAVRPPTPATLLVVDDNPDNRAVLSRRLSTHGYGVLTASSGTEALGMVAQGGVDLVLLDVIMPDMDGLEVLRRLRGEYAMADLPVIMATSLAQSHHTVTALRLGANDYVTKPFDFWVVVARVETQLTLSRALKQAASLAEQLEARNAFIRAAFNRYVSTEVAGQILETPDGLRRAAKRRSSPC